MGIVISVDCDSCGYGQGFDVDVGDLFIPTVDNLIENFLNKRKSSELLKIIEGEMVKECDFYYGLFICDKCETLQRRLHYSLKFMARDEFHSEHNCSKCRRKLREIELNGIKLDGTEFFGTELNNIETLNRLNCRCRSCGMRPLIYIDNILWD